MRFGDRSGIFGENGCIKLETEYPRGKQGIILVKSLCLKTEVYPEFYRLYKFMSFLNPTFAKNSKCALLFTCFYCFLL